MRRHVVVQTRHASAGLIVADADEVVLVNVANPGLTLTERLHEGMQAEARHLGISMEEALTEPKPPARWDE